MQFEKARAVLASVPVLGASAFLPRARAVLLLLRLPSSAAKNLAVVLLAWLLAGSPAWPWEGILILFALAATTSALYLYNALTDQTTDRDVRTKHDFSHRTQIAGTGPLRLVLTVGVVVGVLTAFTVSRGSGLAVIALALFMTLYSSPRVRLKELPVVDVLFGGPLTHMARFAAAWSAFAPGAPPVLPLVALALAKTGGYLLYKARDQADLRRLGLRNTVTILPRRAIIGISVLAIGVAVGLFIRLLQHAGTSLQFPEVLTVYPFWPILVAVPPTTLLILEVLGHARWRPRFLRLSALLYTLVWLGLFWLLRR